MSAEYKLETIKDIFDKVPSGKIALCLSEISAAMVVAKSTAEALPDGAIEFPEVMTWIDDGKGDVEAVFVHGVDGSEIVTAKIR